MSKRKRSLKLVDNTFIRGQEFSIILEVALTGKLRDSSLRSPQVNSLVEADVICCDDPDASTFFLMNKGKDIVAEASILFAIAMAAIARTE